MAYLPRVPDERAGWCGRASTVGRGEGTDKQLSTTWETAFPRCPLTVLHFWAHWGAHWGGEKIYLGRYDLTTPCPPFFPCQQGWDGMDARMCIWM